MSDYDDATRAVHEAAKQFLGEGELAVCWVLTVEVATPKGDRYLAHRSGGGFDGTERPTLWAAVGMLTSDLDDAREQLRQSTVQPDDDDDGAE